ncbi:hypothetical protein RB8275 [Rhodopirellula baltica SH 1]|uniref:Uncharacterized protein n=1 Tax=Rhodopirellula baltica (strain DSM 10527 / NCIMB 13988 / SH1) TaxID=243090 RepID=Q7UFX5_RHOBA|nr:hypothetical protein RB8275 [Rhodopirellula baltica SH 1]
MHHPRVAFGSKERKSFSQFPDEKARPGVDNRIGGIISLRMSFTPF